MGIQQRVPADGGMTYVEFGLSDSKYPFVGASTGGGQVVLEEIIPRGDQGYGEFYSVRGVPHEEIVAGADAHGSVEVERLVEHDDGTLYEFVVGDHCPAVFLGETGALPREVESVDGEGRISAEIPPDTDDSAVISQFLEHHHDAELTAKRHQPYRTPLFSHRELLQGLEERLTDRQQEILAAAHENGYYEWPRDTSGEEIADHLGISPPTFYQHLRAAEQTLITMVFQNTIDQTTDS